MESIKEKEKKVFEIMKKEFGYTNSIEAPRFVKVIVSSGVGSVKDKDKIKLIGDRLSKITGQKPSVCPAKKSVASFKVRQGDVVGYQVTLRGDRMFSFLYKLISIAMPRSKDFRGIPRECLDEMGNITIGIKEHTVFPETLDEELKDIFGLSITMVTTAKSKEEAIKFFEYVGFPFKRSTKNKVIYS